MSLKQRFLTAIGGMLSDDEVREHGEALFESVARYLLSAVREKIKESLPQKPRAVSGIGVTKTVGLDNGVFLQQMKIFCPQIKERPLDVVLKDREVQQVIQQLLTRILAALETTGVRFQAMDAMNFSISFYINPMVNDVEVLRLSNLRRRVVKLAYRKPHLRPHLIPLLAGTSRKKAR